MRYSVSRVNLHSANALEVVALGLSVPSFLIGTAATVSISCRALGGIIGVTIFTAIYDNKYADYVGPELSQDQSAPVDKVSSARAWKYVWITVACLIAANAIAACFLSSVKPMMTAHVESALEESEIRRIQLTKSSKADEAGQAGQAGETK